MVFKLIIFTGKMSADSNMIAVASVIIDFDFHIKFLLFLIFLLCDTMRFRNRLRKE